MTDYKISTISVATISSSVAVTPLGQIMLSQTSSIVQLLHDAGIDTVSFNSHTDTHMFRLYAHNPAINPPSYLSPDILEPDNKSLADKYGIESQWYDPADPDLFSHLVVFMREVATQHGYLNQNWIDKFEDMVRSKNHISAGSIGEVMRHQPMHLVLGDVVSMIGSESGPELTVQSFENGEATVLGTNGELYRLSNNDLVFIRHSV